MHHLLPHISDDYCISGGIATAAQLARAGVQAGERPFNDIDIVTRSLDFLENAKQDFEITELKPSDPTDGFYAALTDKTTNVKVDIFAYSRFPPQAEQAALGDQVVPIRTAANLGALLLCAIERRIRQDLVKIPKQFTDLEALMDIADMQDVEQNWRSFPGRPTPQAAQEAWDVIQTFISSHPGIYRPSGSI